jgi:ribosome-associated heat shock protein Hsp15
MSAKVRIDKWLWAIRVFKTRSLANEACQSGKIKINAIRIKPSRSIQIGDRITVQKGYIKFDYEVTGIIEKRVSASLAQQNYIDHTPEDEKIKTNSKLFTPQYQREKGQGRPTKKDRRDLDKLLGSFED